MVGSSELLFIHDAVYSSDSLIQPNTILRKNNLRDLQNTHFMTLPLVSAVVGSTEMIPVSSTPKGKIIENSQELLDAIAVIVKHHQITNAPVQYSVGVANALPKKRDLPDLLSRNTTKQISQHVVSHLQREGAQDTDITSHYKEATSEALSQLASAHPAANVALATCNLLLQNNNNYKAQLANLGDNIVVIIDFDGRIKYQLGAARYAVESEGAPLIYRPSNVGDLSTVMEEVAFRKEHLACENIDVEADDTIIILSDGAWQLFPHSTTHSQSMHHYITEDSEEFRNTHRSQIIHKKETLLQVDAFQQIIVENKININRINSALSEFMLQETNRKYRELQQVIHQIVQVSFPLLHAQQSTSINNFLGSLPITNEQKTSMQRQLCAEGYNLYSTDEFVRLWETYSSFINGTKEQTVWQYFPVNKTTTEAFLNALFPEIYDNVITLGRLVNILEDNDGFYTVLQRLLDIIAIDSNNFSSILRLIEILSNQERNIIGEVIEIFTELQSASEENKTEEFYTFMVGSSDINDESKRLAKRLLREFQGSLPLLMRLLRMIAENYRILDFSRLQESLLNFNISPNITPVVHELKLALKLRSKVTYPRVVSEQIHRLFLRADDNNIVHFNTNMPLRNFLAHGVYHERRGDCTAVALIQVPNYKTELVRSWIEFPAEATRTAVLTKMLAAGGSVQDIAIALQSLSRDVYDKNSVPPLGVQTKQMKLVQRYDAKQLLKAAKAFIRLIEYNTIDNERPDFTEPQVSAIVTFHHDAYQRIKNDATLNAHRRSYLDKAFGLATTRTKATILGLRRGQALQDLFF